MRLYIDCEFNQYGGELISMALVAENGAEFYESLGCENPEHWVAEHVMPLLAGKPSITIESFQEQLKTYLSQFDTVHIVADWPDDIAYFCKAIITSGMGTRIDTPPLTLEVLRVDAPSKIPHNALADAHGLCDYVMNAAQPQPPKPTEPVQQAGEPVGYIEAWALKAFKAGEFDTVTIFKHSGVQDALQVFTRPAPANVLTDELKAELIHCLNIGYSAQLMTVANSGMTDYKAGKLAEIRAAITKLTNLG